MLWTNTENIGGDFLTQVETEFERCNSVTIASGYVSLDIIKKFYPCFEQIAANGGQARLLLGMAFYEGLSENKLALLSTLHTALEATNSGSGVYVSYNGKYHGKIYNFSAPDQSNYYLGSSNFSRSGLSQNIECTASITDEETQNTLRGFIDFLFLDENAVPITKAEIVIPGSSAYRQKIALTLDDLQKYDPVTIDKSLYPIIEYPLSKAVKNERSNLNVYFGKGRWSRTTGKVIARPWYEAELIANREITSSPLYPKGDFTAFTDDGYVLPMKTGGDYFKNIRSRGNLQLLGQWIKGKLQKSGALLPLTPVTQDTLDVYGNSTIKFYKISDDRYYMEF